MFSREELERLNWTQVGSSGETSSIFKTSFRGKDIIKKVITEGLEEEYQNEISCLLALQGSKHFPRLYCYNDSKLTIYMSYCGKAMTPETRPQTWRYQIACIIDAVHDAGIIYSDIKQDHLRVHNDNTIRVIDFGRSTVGSQRRRQDIHKFALVADFVPNP